MFIGLAVLAAGFITMTLDTAPYGLGLLGITLGPILLVIGFIIEFFAIMVKPEGQISPSADSAPVAAATVTSVSSAPVPAPVAPTPAARPTYKRS
jgi:hypothetical protein